METTAHRRIDTDLFPAVQALEKRIGHTPLHPVTQLFHKKNVQLYAKKEWMQLSGSVKARAAYQIIRKAIESGELNRQTTLLDATSGNTGIAYAHIARLLNIPVALCLPENASRERKDILQSLGVRLILTSRFEGTDGAQQTARAMALENPSAYFYADQYKNPNNWKAHYLTTAPEIFSAVPGITHFVAGLGTTGTFTGTGRRLRELNPSIRLISLQPDSALHGLEGWKHMETAIVPRIYDPTLADANYEVSTEEAYEMMRAAQRHEGLLLSPSSAANLAAAIKVGEQLETGIVVTVFPDNADKYSEVIQKVL
jgi:S-sulfo-L-cysteine synthase (O-acetyl-L-serine-dependent)